MNPPYAAATTTRAPIGTTKAMTAASSAPTSASASFAATSCSMAMPRPLAFKFAGAINRETSQSRERARGRRAERVETSGDARTRRGREDQEYDTSRCGGRARKAHVMPLTRRLLARIPADLEECREGQEDESSERRGETSRPCPARSTAR